METQEDKIRELKQLNIAYSIAVEYDVCPEPYKVDEILTLFIDFDRDELKEILGKYQGCNYRNVINLILAKISRL